MSKPFDATTKQIVEVNPQDWLEFLGYPRLPVEIIDGDLATVTSDVDRLLRILGPPVRLLHIEFESGRDARPLPRRLLRYNTLSDHKFDLPVATVVFLLNRHASRVSEVNGYYKRTHPDTGRVVEFWYRAVRVWEIPAETILQGGIATLPLALLSNLSNRDAGKVAAEMQTRIVQEAASEEDRKKLLSSAYILAGLTFSDTIVKTLFEGVIGMEESSTYQAILRQGREQGVAQGEARGEARGRVDEARRMLLLVCEARLGRPTASVAETLNSIRSVSRLEFLGARLMKVETWDELLANT